MKRAFLLLVLAGCAGSQKLTAPQTPPPRPGPPLTAAMIAQLDDLVIVYRNFGLPFPPTDAPLVRFNVGEGSRGEGPMVPIYSMGFRLKPRPEDRESPVLIGTQVSTESWRRDRLVEVEPLPEFAEDQIIRSGTPFESNAAIATAIQCAARGWPALADALLKAGLEQDAGHPHGAFHHPAGLAPKSAIAFLAWTHYANELAKAGTDRAALLKRLKEIVAAEPLLDTEASRWLFKSLEASLVPTGAPAGSIEAAVDALIEIPREQDFLTGSNRFHPVYLNLGRFGFEGVPALADHLDDERLTRSVLIGFGNFPSYPRTVADIVSDFLQDLSGEELGLDWLDRLKGATLRETAVLAWLEKAKQLGEEEYVVQRVLPHDPARGIHELMLWVIAEKYPGRLASVYRSLLGARPQLPSDSLAERVRESTLPMTKKIEILKEAAAHRLLKHRIPALRGLHALDPDLFSALLLENLKNLPADTREPYWTCPEARIAHLVLMTDDPKAWKALKDAAKGASVGLRMEWLNPMNYSYVGNRQRPERLDFLAAFLDDATIRDGARDPGRFLGPYAGFTFPHLEVRNLAAMKIASILELEDEARPEWTPERWSELRAQVIRALK